MNNTRKQNKTIMGMGMGIHIHILSYISFHKLDNKNKNESGEAIGYHTPHFITLTYHWCQSNFHMK